MLLQPQQLLPAYTLYHKPPHAQAYVTMHSHLPLCMLQKGTSVAETLLDVTFNTYTVTFAL